MKSSLISIIVPVYNAEKYLGRCIESILGQNCSDFELILVNDGSTDRSATICEDYASKDSRIHVIHKENGGVSSARNVGIARSTGEFLTFIDSDDYVSDMFLYNLVGGITDKVDIIIGGCSVARFGEIKKRAVIPCTAIGCDFDEVLKKNYIQTGPWAKLFRKNFLDCHKIKFKEGMQMGEDALFVFSSMSLAEGITVVEDTSYIYNNEVAPTSLTQKLYSFDVEMQTSTLIDNVVETLILNKNIRSVEALSNLNDVKCIYKYRAISSVYKMGWPRDRRIEALQKIDTSNMWLYSLRKDGFKPWLLSHLLRLDLINSYDLVRSSATLLRK